MNRLWVLLLWSISFSGLADNLILVGASKSSITSTIQEAWQSCGEAVWCADDIHYYRQEYMAEAELKESVEINLFTEFTPHHFSNVQLNLRQDGFELTKVIIDEQLFDVAEELRKASRAEVDKALVLFLNRFAQNDPRTMQWRSPQWIAQLESDGEIIMIRFRLIDLK